MQNFRKLRDLSEVWRYPIAASSRVIAAYYSGVAVTSKKTVPGSIRILLIFPEYSLMISAAFLSVLGHVGDEGEFI